MTIPVMLLLLVMASAQVHHPKPRRKATAPPAPLTLDPGGPQSLWWPSAHQGAIYQFFLEASGGTPPYTFTLNQTIPGVTLVDVVDPSGVKTVKLYGKVKPVLLGKHNITVTVNDAAGNAATRNHPIRVCAAYIDNEYTSSAPCL